MACLEASKLRHFVKMNDEWCDGEGGPADRRHDRRKCKSHARNSQKKIYVTSFGTQPPIGLLVHPQAHKPTACALSTPAWSYRTNHAQSTSSSISAGASNPYARPCPHGPTRPGSTSAGGCMFRTSFYRPGPSAGAYNPLANLSQVASSGGRTCSPSP